MSDSLRTCPACKQLPEVIWAEDNRTVEVECDCGLRGPYVVVTHVPLECFAYGTDRNSAAESEAIRGWNEIPAHGLASGEESPWLVVVTALRDALVSARRNLREAEYSARKERENAAKWLRIAQESREALAKARNNYSILTEKVTDLEAELRGFKKIRERVPGADRFGMLEIE